MFHSILHTLRCTALFCLAHLLLFLFTLWILGLLDWSPVLWRTCLVLYVPALAISAALPLILPIIAGKRDSQ
jgi:hypothetical protein